MLKQLKSHIILVGTFAVSPFYVMAASPDLESLEKYRTPISLSGSIQPAETLKVQSSVSGRIAQIHVKENQVVAENQLLLTIKNDTQTRQLELAQLQVNISDNNIKDRKRQQELGKVQIQVNENNITDAIQQLELSKVQIEVSSNNVKDLETNVKDIKRRLTDQKALFEQGSSTRSQLDAVQLQYDRSKFALDNSKLALKRVKQEIKGVEIRVKNSKLTLERSKADLKRTELGVENALLNLKKSNQDVELRKEALEDTRVKSKIGGIITNQFSEEGEVINAGAVLFQIINLEQIEIEVQLDEDDLPAIKAGQGVVFTTSSYRNEKFTGTIERISWIANAQTGRFPIYISAKNPDMKLRAGMSAKVYLLMK